MAAPGTMHVRVVVATVVAVPVLMVVPMVMIVFVVVRAREGTAARLVHLVMPVGLACVGVAAASPFAAGVRLGAAPARPHDHEPSRDTSRGGGEGGGGIAVRSGVE